VIFHDFPVLARLELLQLETDAAIGRDGAEVVVLGLLAHHADAGLDGDAHHARVAPERGQEQANRPGDLTRLAGLGSGSHCGSFHEKELPGAGVKTTPLAPLLFQTPCLFPSAALLVALARHQDHAGQPPEGDANVRHPADGVNHGGGQGDADDVSHGRLLSFGQVSLQG
jgi:hypothetical protein